MIKLGIIQTKSCSTNEEGVERVAKILNKLGKKETQIVCLPEQWLKNNQISDFDTTFAKFKKISKEYNMTIIPGAFYHSEKRITSIVAPIINSDGEILEKQEKIHPFDYEKDTVRPGNEAKIFQAGRHKFGIIVCYDMVFSDVSNKLVKKGAQVLISPSRIVRRGIEPWHMYVQVRALENRIPILAANVEDRKFGGKSMLVDLKEKNKVMVPKLTTLNGEIGVTKDLDLDIYKKSREIRFSDSNRFD